MWMHWNECLLMGMGGNVIELIYRWWSDVGDLRLEVYTVWKWPESEWAVIECDERVGPKEMRWNEWNAMRCWYRNVTDVWTEMSEVQDERMYCNANEGWCVKFVMVVLGWMVVCIVSWREEENGETSSAGIGNKWSRGGWRDQSRLIGEERVG